MRRVLDGLYRLCGWLAAFFLVAIAVLILLQVGGRLVGVLIPSADDLAGFAMAASSFLGLAYALRAGGHIRVSLVLQRLAGGPRRWAELWCLAAGSLLTGYFAWYSGAMTWEFFAFGDVSPGLLPIPLWIPQSTMTLGLGLICVALVDDLVAVAKGRPASYEGAGGDLLESEKLAAGPDAKL
ncbi:TRAP transporter small permease [Skermanella sp. TT6]|uniref:TRAP transporter small permease protein n=1 Tax=Skermanella cutis TaxID=2775420 RepID=A0ABX7B6Q4_9PROT|nr:TRAP transporter small permease [Skermanella sp. TT6]QQP90007.1 TRAP transporter small permease [Skermanella sp. TT6]